jgi:hypothetical protein
VERDGKSLLEWIRIHPLRGWPGLAGPELGFSRTPTASVLRNDACLRLPPRNIIPLKRNIYGEWPRQSRTLSGIIPPPEGYKNPITEKAAMYFRINDKSVIRRWWAARDIIAKGGIIKQYPPKWPELKAQLWDQFVAARKAHRIITVSRELATWHCSDLAATLWRTYSG